MLEGIHWSEVAGFTVVIGFVGSIIGWIFLQAMENKWRAWSEEIALKHPTQDKNDLRYALKSDVPAKSEVLCIEDLETRFVTRREIELIKESAEETHRRIEGEIKSLRPDGHSKA